MHLTLINPPFTVLGRGEMSLSQCMGLLYIAGYAREKGHDVTIIDALQAGQDHIEEVSEGYLRVGYSKEEIIDRIPDETDLIGVSVPFSHLAYEGHRLVAAIKEARNSTPVVMGGMYPSTQPKQAFGSKADYLVLGEGEEPVVKLLEYLANGAVGSLPDGVACRAQAGSIDTVEPYRTEDPDLIPFPARDLIPFENYLGWSQRNLRGWRTASLVTSRGCPFNCEFCSVHPVCGHKWRPHSAERVLAEIDHLIETYNINNFEIEDDNFTLEKERAVQILEGIIERNKKGANISWRAFNGLRIDSLTDDLIDLFAKSNCRHVNLALEHGDEEMLKIMGKRLKRDVVLDIARSMRRVGIPSNVFAIYGYPGETKERFENSLSFYKRLKEYAPGVGFYFLIAQPYPGTRLFDRCVKEGWLESDVFSTPEKMARFSAQEIVWIETEDFDKAEVLRRGRLLRKTCLSKSVYFRHEVRRMLPGFLVQPLQMAFHVVKRIKERFIRSD